MADLAGYAARGQEEAPEMAETPQSLDLLQFLNMLQCRDAAQRVAALDSVNHGIFQTDTNLFRKVVPMLNDPVWDVKRAAVHLLSELGPLFDDSTIQSLNRLLFHFDPVVQLMIAYVLKNVEGADDYFRQVLSDRSIAQAAVGRFGGILEFLGSEFKDDREIVMTAVSQDGRSLKHAKQDFRDDEEVVLAAVAQNGCAVHCANQDIIDRHAGLRALREGRGISLCGDYLVMNQIGKGVYGEVTRAEHMITENVVAIKKLHYDQEDVLKNGISPQTLREVALLRKLKHPNVVRMIDVMYVGLFDLRLVFELHPTDLHKELVILKQNSQRMPIEQVRRYTANILDGLEACHGRNLLHRDLKPQNILLGDDGQLKIADFGLARSMVLRPCTTEVITLWYRCPELLLGENRYGFEVDCWSAGCVIAEMSTSRALFPGDSEIGTLFKIFQLQGTPSDTNWPEGTKLYNFKDRFPKWPGTGLTPILEVQPELLNCGGDDLLRQLLCLHPARRLSSRKARRHRFCERNADAEAQ